MSAAVGSRGATPNEVIVEIEAPDFEAIEASLRHPIFIGHQHLGRWTPGQVLYDFGTVAVVPVMLSGVGLVLLEVEVIKTSSLAAVLFPLLGVVFALGVIGGLHLTASVMINRPDDGVDQAMRLHKESWRVTQEVRQSAVSLKETAQELKKQSKERVVMFAKQVAVLNGMEAQGVHIEGIVDKMDTVHKKLSQAFAAKLDRMKRMNDRRAVQLEKSEALISRREEALRREEGLRMSEGSSGRTQRQGEGAGAEQDAPSSSEVTDEMQASVLRLQTLVRRRNARLEVDGMRHPIAGALVSSGDDTDAEECV
jgi:hypothetical protein